MAKARVVGYMNVLTGDILRPPDGAEERYIEVRDHDEEDDGDE